MTTPLPGNQEIRDATLEALKMLGGSGTISEIHDKAVDILELSEEQIARPYKSTNQTEIYTRLAVARTHLKKRGLVENPQYRLWALPQKRQKKSVGDARQVTSDLAAESRMPKPAKPSRLVYLEDGAEAWRDSLFDVLTQMHPSAFERLFQRVLRESGFTQVEVTGRSGDGGIDGIGVVRIGGFLSFRVLFQCKRFKGAIGAGAVRDFRGAMIGRTDKGLIVTTGNYTPAAVREATRDGAPEIDLIDGDLLMDKLKELSLGVKTEEVVIERVTVNPDFFAGI